MRVIIFFLLLHHLSSAQTWLQLPDITTTKRDDGVGVLVNNKAYFGTGLQEWEVTRDFRSLDLATNTWTDLPNMPDNTDRQYACAFRGTNCFYVFGGDGKTGPLNTLFRYNISSNSWSTMASKPGNGLVGAACFVFGDKIIISAGKSTAGINKEVWEYTISADSWSQKKNINIPAAFRTSFTTLNNSGYMAFGIDSAGSYKNNLYKYDASSDNWSLISQFPQGKGRAYAAMQAFADRLFIFGGADSLGNIYGDSWNYVLSTNSWIQGNSHPVSGRRGGMSVATAKDFYYTCGISKEAGRLTETWRTDVPLSVTEIKQKREVILMPQPADNSISVFFIGNEGLQIKSYAILNLNGEEVLREKFLQSTECSINLTPLVTGMYMIRLILSDDQMLVKKLIKN